MLSVIINITAAVILLVCLGFIAYWLVAAKQGDCEFRLLKGKKTPFKVDSMDSRRAELSCTVPIKNVGRQNGTIMDAFARPYMPQEQYDRVNVRALLMDMARPRTDDYWEALIVERGRTVELRVQLTLEAKEGGILKALEEFPDMPLDVIYQTVGRSDWAYEKGRIWLTEDELREALYEYTAGHRG